MNRLSTNNNQNVETVDTAINAWTALFLASGFFTPLGFGAPNELLYFFGLITLVGAKAKHVRDKRYSRPIILASISYLFAICVALLASPYAKSNLLSNALFLISAVILFVCAEVKEDERITRLFYVTSSAAITISCFLFILSPSFFVDALGLTVSSSNYAPLLLGQQDKNWTGVFIFLFLCLSFKKRWRYGIALGFLYPFLYFGRQYLMMIAVFLIALYLFSKKKGERSSDRREKKGIAVTLYFTAFVVTTTIVLGGSFYWSENVIGSDTTGYKLSLNDDSNAMRTLSNVYAVEEVMSDHAFLLYGYDSDVFEKLGISSSNTSVDENVYIHGLWRLVVPHEEVLNMLLKEGVLVTITYYIMVSVVLARMSLSKENRSILISYFLGSMLLSSMFKNEYLLLLCLVLFVSENPKKAPVKKERTRKRFPGRRLAPFNG